MSSDPIISVRGVGKCYNLYEKPSDRLKQMMVNRLARGSRKRFYREHWALRQVNLDIRCGETVGIVGENGSGKSTLLQLICGTLTPTEGELQVNGRIAPLLQLGAGFNPEFTGRENVALNAAILGLSADEIDERFDAIVAFADIGEMLEQPVKLYSSGMHSRLAFAVAINVDAEILIVDEALAVGDEGFQRKCFARIEAMRSSGTTILFVSHATATIQELCDRAILLDKGEILQDGTPNAVVKNYQRLTYAPHGRRDEERNRIKSGTVHPSPSVLIGEKKAISEDAFDPSLVPLTTDAYPSLGAHIRNVRIRNMENEQVNLLQRFSPYWYEYEVEFDRQISNVSFAMVVKAINGLRLGSQVSSSSPDQSISVITPGTTLHVKLPLQLPLSAGTYFGNAGVVGILPGEAEPVIVHRIVDAIMFKVLPVPSDRIHFHVDVTGGLSPIISYSSRQRTNG
ncbi:ABC transporter ATP-binding protein [Bradyrhizobium sp. CCBAU 53340]|uniref:ABC transporter ATP-binding protein n=1 Tax=Bradyrhizobium sp. CCBAU 53340 TaxID=1325112 RepID=UPI00188A7AF8|nr:ABC transporter ATP-binding protein [Bradyrhizobium sp. CCBAU 53340]QOZ43989.1 ABC transporter ATP-binding protein [Bradyrhizobium sp. CCBAU 53340]